MATLKKLKKGDTIAIVAPAKQIAKEVVENATQLLENRGYRVIISKNCCQTHHYFSGTVEQRSADLQWAIDSPEVDAVLFARGGYGCIQILGKINWTSFLKNPKWLIGFSDITVFHQWLAKHQIPSLHATMPLNFMDNSNASLQTLFEILEEDKMKYQWTLEKERENFTGKAEGTIIGGNLSVLRSLLGTKHQPEFTHKILFLEDVGEYLYALDRNLYQLNNAGILDEISGAIIGDFGEMKDTPIPYGQNLYEIIFSHFRSKNIPVAFHFPAGHCDDNRAILLGRKVYFEVEKRSAKLELIPNGIISNSFWTNL